MKKERNIFDKAFEEVAFEDLEKCSEREKALRKSFEKGTRQKM